MKSMKQPQLVTLKGNHQSGSRTCCFTNLLPKPLRYQRETLCGERREFIQTDSLFFLCHIQWNGEKHDSRIATKPTNKIINIEQMTGRDIVAKRGWKSKSTTVSRVTLLIVFLVAFKREWIRESEEIILGVTAEFFAAGGHENSSVVHKDVDSIWLLGNDCSPKGRQRKRKNREEGVGGWAGTESSKKVSKRGLGRFIHEKPWMSIIFSP